MNDSTVEYAARCYGTTKSELKPLSGGHYSAVYEFSVEDRTCVLRIAPVEINVDVTKGMIEWVDFLSQHGAPVSKPVLSVNDRIVEFIEEEKSCHFIVAFEKAKGILAETLSKDRWNDRLCQSVGRAVGKMHGLAKGYAPSAYSFKRPDWDTIGNCYNAENLDSSQAIIREKNERILNYLGTLPKDKDCYGLIHCDLHFANLYVDAGDNMVTIFDFDDCSYGWYAMDIAMALFDIAVLYDGPDKEEFATRFMKNYLKGYLSENCIDTFWIKQLPYFLKLLEIGVYSQLYKDYDLNDPDSWCGRFMADRKHRIENDIPYMSIDFENILEMA